MKAVLRISLAVLLLAACGRQPADLVNVFNGTDFAGNTYPGATVPFGAVQLIIIRTTASWVSVTRISPGRAVRTWATFW